MRAAASSALLAVLLAQSPVMAQEPVDRLLQELGRPATQRADGVVVLGWVERGRDGRTQLVVSLAPRGAIKLVADPGITVFPVARDGLTWTSAEPAIRVQEHADYFASEQQLRLPFSATTGGSVEADVEYAYCIVREQCLFGHTRVSVPAGALPTG